MGEVNTHKPRMEGQGAELAMGSPVLGSFPCSRACLLSDRGKDARRGVNYMGGKSQTELLKGGYLFKLYPCYSKSSLKMKQDDFSFVSIGFERL